MNIISTVHINILVTCCSLTVGDQLAKTKVKEELDYIVILKMGDWNEIITGGSSMGRARPLLLAMNALR